MRLYTYIERGKMKWDLVSALGFQREHSIYHAKRIKMYEVMWVCLNARSDRDSALRPG